MVTVYLQLGGHFIVLTELNGDTITVYDPYLYSGKFDTSTRRGKATVDGNKVYVGVENFINYANAKGFFCYAHDGNTTVNNTQPVVTATYTRYVNARIGLNVRNAPDGYRISGLANGTKVTVAETDGSWSRIISPVSGWVSSNYLVSSNNTVVYTSGQYKTGIYKVNASVLNVRTGPGTKYRIKSIKELTRSARNQGGYVKGVRFTVNKVIGNWGLTPSGYVCLDYCTKL